MTGWGRDSERDADWLDFAVQLRAEKVRAEREPRWWHIADLLLGTTVAICTVYVIFFVAIPFVQLLRADGVIR